LEWHEAGATGTQTAVYATSTVAPTGPTASGTTQCGKYYDVQAGDMCQLIALNNSISVPLFEDINPSVNSNCGNLVPGLYYCVWPMIDWNVTASSNHHNHDDGSSANADGVRRDFCMSPVVCGAVGR
jgi:hypothetical protein